MCECCVFDLEDMLPDFEIDLFEYEDCVFQLNGFCGDLFFDVEYKNYPLLVDNGDDLDERWI